MRDTIQQTLGRFGYKLARTQKGGWPLDFRPDETRIVQQVQPYTMTSCERIKTMIDATRYVVAGNIPGAVVECGVWRGGSMMAAALILHEMGARRELVLCDLFDAAMPTPSALDGTVTGDAPQAGGQRYWNYVTLAEVAANLKRTGYGGPVRYVVGPVEDTLPVQAPAQIALLRLDTDWYGSTRHELETLYPRLSPGGVLIVDDYGSHHGVRKAVDEFFASRRRPLLVRVDISAVVACVPSGDQ